MTKILETNLLPTYARAPVTFVEGDGCWLTDDNGKRYLDFAGGSAVIGLGHRHPASTRAAHEQLDRLWHTSNLYWTVPMMELAQKLSDRFGGAQAFFCNSGTEAVEAAIKYARKGTGKVGAVALEGSFHGRTMGSLSVTGQPAQRETFAPLLNQVSFAFLNNPLSLRAAALADTGLIILEPIQGNGGVRPIDIEFAHAARALADELGALLCFDEVQTGVGRTGSFSPSRTSAYGPTWSRSPRGWPTASRSAPFWWPTAPAVGSNRAITPRPSAATPCPAPPGVPSLMQSTRNCSRTFKRWASAWPRGCASFPASRKCAAQVC